VTTDIDFSGTSFQQLVRKITHGKLFLPILCLILVMMMNVAVNVSSGGSPLTFFEITLTNGTLNGPLITILNRSSELVIVALGMTICVSCSAGTDISVGAVMAFSGAVSIWALGFGTLPQNDYHVKEYVIPYVLGLAIAIGVGAIAGAWNGFLVANLRIQPMVATLILYTGGRGAAKVFADGQIDKVDVPNYKWLGNFIQDDAGNNLVPIPTAIFIAAGMVIFTALILRYTAWGMNIQSVGINNRASRIFGLNSARIILIGYIFCGVCAGIAGIIATSRIGGIDANNCGKMLELDAILAVALGGNSLAGGKFSLSGSVIGAVTIQALTTVLYSVNVSADQLPVYKAVVVVIIVVLQSPELRPMVNKGLAFVRQLSSRGQEVQA
jgi:simple sugar transport system permease protein